MMCPLITLLGHFRKTYSVSRVIHLDNLNLPHGNKMSNKICDFPNLFLELNRTTFKQPTQFGFGIREFFCDFVVLLEGESLQTDVGILALTSVANCSMRFH